MEKLEELKCKIDKYPEKHIDILKLLKKHDIPFTENKNGVFLNLSVISDEMIKILYEYINYIEDQNTLIETFEKQKTQCELMLQ